MYNGNIAAMAVIINPGVDSPLVYSYHYDQLNRLAQMDAYKGLNYSNHSFTPVKLPDYQERPAYDPNGNITNYVRHGFGANIPMDSLTYNYYANTNQLQRINDGAGGSYTTDLKDQGSGSNYTYDLIGNLKQDVTNGVTAINWTVYGKIDSINNGSGWITYTYDAAGNRITKTVGTTTTVYVRDAQGNVLSIYTQTGSGSAAQTEVDLYGSSRLGSVRALTVAPTIFALTTGYGNATVSTFTREEKSYELINHLGNVLTTVTDKKIAVVSGSNSSLIDHFTADIATAQDYYPFGMLMPGRTFTASTATNYRFGFNGKENDNEVKGVGNEIDYGMRGYDPRVGRFLSVDPLTGKYPWYTPYQYAGNKPVWAVDVDGLEEAPTTPGTEEGQPKVQTKITESARFGTIIQTKTYYWHAGSKAYGTKAGWYNDEDYQNALTPIAHDLAGYEGLLTSAANAGQYHNWTAAEKADFPNSKLAAFIGSGLSEDAARNLGISTENYVNARNFRVTGVAGSPAFNTEDFVFVITGLLKGGAKVFGEVIAKNTAKDLTIDALKGLPIQIHHYATNINARYTAQLNAIAKQFGLDLDGAWNKEALPHLGRHPNAYHEFVLSGMQRAASEAGQSQSRFLELFEKYVKKPIRDNPGLLRKSGW